MLLEECEKLLSLSDKAVGKRGDEKRPMEKGSDHHPTVDYDLRAIVPVNLRVRDYYLHQKPPLIIE
jgi:hypothetical protein